MIKVNEIFKSIQGESTYTGFVCSFIRLTGCNLRCSWCDTEYAYSTGENMQLDDILTKIKKHKTNLVEITGGEPLLQKDTPLLAEMILKNGYKLLIETNGTLDISILPKKAIKIVDVKCPGSNVDTPFLTSNLQYITQNDEIKFIIADENDFLWAKQFIKDNNLAQKCTVTFSPVDKNISKVKLAELILEHNLNIRLGVQLHKIIWGDKKGV